MKVYTGIVIKLIAGKGIDNDLSSTDPFVYKNLNDFKQRLINEFAYAKRFISDDAVIYDCLASLSKLKDMITNNSNDINDANLFRTKIRIFTRIYEV